MFESVPVCLLAEWLLSYPHSPQKRGAEMPFCTHCGLEYQQPANFCNRCGRALPVAAVRAAVEESPVAAVEERAIAAATPSLELPYYLSLNRIFFMTALTFGFYLFYWFYLTWQQYRDYAGKEAYPVWHALALEVPIYGSFRAHAHASAYRELMRDADLPGSIKAPLAVVLTLIAWILAFAAFTDSFSPLALTRGGAVGIVLVDAGAMVAVIALLVPLQSNLNGYWHSRPNWRVSSASVGFGEIIFGIVGAVAWLRALANISG